MRPMTFIDGFWNDAEDAHAGEPRAQSRAVADGPLVIGLLTASVAVGRSRRVVVPLQDHSVGVRLGIDVTAGV
jgi:hypothetical protein